MTRVTVFGFPNGEAFPLKRCACGDLLLGRKRQPESTGSTRIVGAAYRFEAWGAAVVAVSDGGTAICLLMGDRTTAMAVRHLPAILLTAVEGSPVRAAAQSR